jgi:hypothetical protein
MKISGKILPAFFLLFFLSGGTQAAEKEAFFTVTVPPEQFKAARLRNLPEGADVGVAVESSRLVTIAVIDSADYSRLPHPQKPLMVGKVDRKLTFSVSIPASGDYFVVLVNPDTRNPADVKVKVQAARGAKDRVDRADQILRLFERQMHKLFVFDSFDIGVKNCGRSLAFYGVDGFTLCREYVSVLGKTIPDRKMAKSMLRFSIFHELGLELMGQWGIAGPSMRRSADELAVVMMIMLKQEESLRELGTYVKDHPEVAASLETALIDDWHPLSVKRAEKLLGWLENAELARSWQKKLVPHMQTELLRWLKKKPTDWSDTTLVNAELARRGDTGTPSKTSEPEKPATL